MSEIDIVAGNIFDCTEDIICHQTNCQGVMGHGIALQVKNRYPVVFEAYTDLCKHWAGDKEDLLGRTLIVDTKTDKYIANIFGQINYGEGLQTDYERLKKGLIVVRDYAEENNLSVAIPYKIGCGLANGDWNIVYQDIVDVFKNSSVPCKIYRFERNEKYGKNS